MQLSEIRKLENVTQPDNITLDGLESRPSPLLLGKLLSYC